MTSAPSALVRILRERIVSEGPITVAEYMATVLGHPRYGYYTTRDPFGRAGDFITAPEISQMFGELIGLWAAAVWQILGTPEQIRLIELGPGRGTLMADAMRAVQQAAPAFLDALRVDLVEISPVLREHQQSTLGAWRARVDVQWHDSIEAVPEGVSIILANEFFDALPVRQYERISGGWCERLVGLDPAGNFRFERGDRLADDSVVPEPLRYARTGAIFESCPGGSAVIRATCARLTGHGGACLIVDYGHTEQGLGETLQAVKNQKYHDPLSTPGEADLTAHVDFEALSAAARDGGCCVFGPVTQRAFLENIGIQARAETLSAAAPPAQAEDIRRALERLIGEDEMGTLFKVVCFAGSGIAAIPGFE